MIELYTNVGDSVYFIEFPKSANITNNEKPYIQKATVNKVEYSNHKGYERFRVDFEFKNKYGYMEYRWFIWADNFLYTSKEDAENKLQEVI